MGQTEYRTHVALIYGVTGQTVEFYPPIEEIIKDGGTLSAAATYQVFGGTQSNDDTPLLTGTATADAATVVTDTDEACGPSKANRSRVPLTATNGVRIGRRYLLNDSSAGRMMIVVPKAIASADSVTHETELFAEFATGSVFVGLRQTFTIDSTFIQTASNINVSGALVDRVLPFNSSDTATSFPPYRIRWAYATGGAEPRRYWTTFDVCRAPAQHSVTVENVRAMVPDIIWDEWTQQRGQDFAPQIHEAFERLRFDIRMAGYDPNMVTDPLIMDRLTTLAAVARIMRALDKDQSGDYEKDYRNAFEKAIGTGLRAWMQTDSSGGITPNPARQLWLER